MKKIHTLKLQRKAVAAAALLAVFGTAQAVDWEVSGLIRQELAVKTTNHQNSYNTNGGAMVGVPHTNTSLANIGPAAGMSPTLTRPAYFGGKSDINWFATRLEINLDGKISESLKATIKLRGILDETRTVENRYGTRTVAPGVNTGDGNILAGSSFRQQFGGTAGGPLAYATDRALIDLPAAYLDYNSGPLWVRAGNQQIAWGEAMFFRVADQPNGLDLRGQLFGVSAEEYSDKRRSALGLRVNYRFDEKTNIDTFVQKFTPTLVPNAETAYNVIQSQFTVDQQPGYEDVKDKWNLGFRLKGEAGGFGYQAFAINRHNPDGVIKWTAAKNAGPLTGTPFAASANGVYNATEWFNAASSHRLNGIKAVESFLNFIAPGVPLLPALAGMGNGCGFFNEGGASATGAAGGFSVNNRDAAGCYVDSFLDPNVAPGVTQPLRGWLSREYKRETVIGGGVNRVFEGAPDTLLDQLIGRFEFSYTPDKKFTNPTLGDYIEKDEYQFAFIFEKYHKFTHAFPATYFVAQWMHKSESDLFGRHLSGVNTPLLPDGRSSGTPEGQSNFNAIAIAVQQPSPTLEYRFDLSVLTDLKGGWYIQPGVKWKPSKAVQVDLYLNAMYSQNKGQYKDFIDGMQSNNEIFARVAYQF